MDVVVTVPQNRWLVCIDEGDPPGEPWSGHVYHFSVAGAVPRIQPGERVYVVAHGKLRGYAPLLALGRNGHRIDVIRSKGAGAVTIPEPNRSFRGWRYRW